MHLTGGVVLPHDLTAPRRVRMWIAERLAPLDLAEPSVEEILLVASELVTNVIVHTASAPEITLDADERTVRIEVADSSTEPAQIREPAAGRPGGWGLLLVDSIADSWGTDRRENGTKVVWFTRDVS